MSWHRFLLDAAVGVPLLLTALALLPTRRGLMIRLLPFAALPGLAAALLVPSGTAQPLPQTLLGAGLVMEAQGRVFLGIAALLWTLAGITARASVTGERRDRFAGFWLATLTGNMLLVLAADVVSFYLAFAILSLSAFGLVVHDGTAEARRAGRIYLLLAIVGETALLLGLLVAASGVGSVFIADIRSALPALPRRDLALALMIAGFGLKAGLVPLHVWLPLAHPAAPVPASAVLSGAIVKAGIFGLMQFLPLGTALPDWSGALVTLGLTTAYYGVAAGLFQRRAKAVLAYSTVSQMGLIVTVLGAGLASPGPGLALSAAGFYAAHHGLAKGALFLSVGVLHAAGGASRRPLLLLTGLTALAIAGLPFTGGALAKLAVKGPLGTGAAALLVTLSAVGTTLLMLRFLMLVRRDTPAPHLRPRPAVLLPFAGAALAALTLPWLLFPAASGQALAYAFSPATLWGAAWPLLLGAAILAGAVRWGRAAPVVPEGDLVAPAERLVNAAIGRAQEWQAPAPQLPLQGALARVGAAAGRVEAAAARWPVIAPVLLAAVVVLALATV
ncbi:NADH/ubiquinone/plastoquinone (complex I) [Erythrobacteraceae bacterium CFH 75059]|uniref:complex I subunit 5 family protein n=1 Tax=Qipengyuania thermophila TaxID=2509361 RepID=UPI0010217741|nr:complex I subunit 5 family protein [Qipengyuania thermophila]TCD06775.1 NADH/ubiquinone/plastoquinone (complex I) [Erythrobacteraceae bacterium CFH 75059]